MRGGLQVTTYNPSGGIVNTGFWGVPLNGGWIYHFSVYLKTDGKSNDTTVPPPPLPLPPRGGPPLQSTCMTGSKPMIQA